MTSEERDDELVSLSELHADDVPAGIDRRAFMITYKETSEGGLAVAVVLC